MIEVGDSRGFITIDSLPLSPIARGVVDSNNAPHPPLHECQSQEACEGTGTANKIVENKDSFTGTGTISWKHFKPIPRKSTFRQQLLEQYSAKQSAPSPLKEITQTQTLLTIDTNNEPVSPPQPSVDLARGSVLDCKNQNDVTDVGSRESEASTRIEEDSPPQGAAQIDQAGKTDIDELEGELGFKGQFRDSCHPTLTHKPSEHPPPHFNTQTTCESDGLNDDTQTTIGSFRDTEESQPEAYGEGEAYDNEVADKTNKYGVAEESRGENGHANENEKGDDIEQVDQVNEAGDEEMSLDDEEYELVTDYDHHVHYNSPVHLVDPTPLSSQGTMNDAPGSPRATIDVECELNLAHLKLYEFAEGTLVPARPLKDLAADAVRVVEKGEESERCGILGLARKRGGVDVTSDAGGAKRRRRGQCSSATSDVVSIDDRLPAQRPPCRLMSTSSPSQMLPSPPQRRSPPGPLVADSVWATQSGQSHSSPTASSSASSSYQSRFSFPLGTAPHHSPQQEDSAFTMASRSSSPSPPRTAPVTSKLPASSSPARTAFKESAPPDSSSLDKSDLNMPDSHTYFSRIRAFDELSRLINSPLPSSIRGRRGSHTSPSPDLSLLPSDPSPSHYTTPLTVPYLYPTLSPGAHLALGHSIGKGSAHPATVPLTIPPGFQTPAAVSPQPIQVVPLPRSSAAPSPQKPFAAATSLQKMGALPQCPAISVGIGQTSPTPDVSGAGSGTGADRSPSLMSSIGRRKTICPHQQNQPLNGWRDQIPAIITKNQEQQRLSDLQRQRERGWAGGERDTPRTGGSHKAGGREPGGNT
eukprot:GHVN01006712.1.p1 GENE.GHVN01006712.1~~GHVN01006712.1.p1  ORF type:complete len:812 (-),score=160.75 GHVN01006712.1:2120-4555(-)